jgi:hypothetical protein
MLTYFSRHTAAMGVDTETREKLWDENRIGVHFPHDRNGALPAQDNPSFDSSDYNKRGKRAIRLLNEMAQDGGYVCAEFFGHSEVKIGLVESGSKIELLKGHWGMKWGNVGREAILKTLRLTKTKILNASEAAVLLVGRPQQGTLNRWPNARDSVRNLVDGLIGELTISSLHPFQQEILCSEYLRSDDAVSNNLPKLESLTALPGRTMKDVDIIGVTSKGEKIFAQVTHRDIATANGKLNALQKFSLPGQHAILFCQCEQRHERDGIVAFPIQQVFSTFKIRPWYDAWINFTNGKSVRE